MACACTDHLSSRQHAALWPSVAAAQLGSTTLGSPLPTSARAVTPPTTKAFPRSPTTVWMHSDAYQHISDLFRTSSPSLHALQCALALSLCVRGVCPLPHHMRLLHRMPALPLCQSDSRIASPHAMLAPHVAGPHPCSLASSMRVLLVFVVIDTS